jgi:hypothetical protein
MEMLVRGLVCKRKLLRGLVGKMEALELREVG